MVWDVLCVAVLLAVAPEDRVHSRDSARVQSLKADFLHLFTRSFIYMICIYLIHSLSNSFFI